jgi:hypothetical protein
VPFDFEKFDKLDHYIIGGRWIFITCRNSRCGNQRVLDLRRFDPEWTVKELEKVKFRCSQCGSDKVELRRELEREWKRRIKR